MLPKPVKKCVKKRCLKRPMCEMLPDPVKKCVKKTALRGVLK
jgi:hypothetical protein